MDAENEAQSPEVEVSLPWDGLRSRRAKMAFTLDELVQLTSEFSMYRKDGSPRTSGCVASPIRTDRKQFLAVYRVKCSERDKDGNLISDPAGHVVRMKFDVKHMKSTGNAHDLDVRVSCSCVAPETWVRMADGTEKMIKDVHPGDMVITHKGRARRVTHVTSREARPDERAYELTAQGYRGPLILSEDHPVAVVRGHEECACGCGKPLELTYSGRGTVRERWGRKWATGHAGRGVSSPRQDHSGGQALWRKAPELVEGEQLYFPRIQWSGNTKVDPDFASLVGYYLAEGSLQRVKAKRSELSTVAAQVDIKGELTYLYGVDFALNKNEMGTLVADIQAKILKIYPEARVGVRMAASGNGCRVEVKCPRMADDCYRLVGCGSLEKRLSPEILTWDTEAMLEVAASWALGDGYCGENTQKVATSSKDLATQMSTFLQSVGVWHTFTYEDRPAIGARGYRLSWDYRRSDLLVQHMRSRMRTPDALRVDAHLGDTKERRTEIMWGEGYLGTMSNLVQRDAPKEFMDLTVDEDSSFIANGVLVHNCPAFLFWGSQWNLGTGDALYGAPRPKYQPPTEARRYEYVICKHVKLVSDRVMPLVEGMVSAYKKPGDLEREEESKKQIEEVKRQQEVERKQIEEQEKKKKPEPIEPKKPTPEEDLEAMPEDLTELGLPPRPPVPVAPKRKPITQKILPPEEPEVPQEVPPVPTKEPTTPPEATEVGPKARRMLPRNITLVEEEEEPTTILPGAKARRMQELQKPEETIPAREDVEAIPPSPRSPAAPKTPTRPGVPRPVVPKNVTIVDEDEEEPTLLPGSRWRHRSSSRFFAALKLAEGTR